jgi:hypothetical protein
MPSCLGRARLEGQTAGLDFSSVQGALTDRKIQTRPGSAGAFSFACSGGAILEAHQPRGVTLMADDRYARAIGMTSRTLLTHLLHRFVNKNILTKQEVENLWRDTEKELIAHQTETSAGTSGIIQTIREGLEKP